MEIHIENLPRTVELLADEGGPVFQYIDERLLPGELRMAQTRDWRAVIEAIKVLAVRGAPAIGIAGAAAMALWAAYDGENLEAATEDIADSKSEPTFTLAAPTAAMAAPVPISAVPASLTEAAPTFPILPRADKPFCAPLIAELKELSSWPAI